MQPQYGIADTVYPVAPLRQQDHLYWLDIDGQQLVVQLDRIDEQRCDLWLQGKHYHCCCVQDGDQLHIHLAGRHWRLQALNAFAGDSDAGGANSGNVRAPMPGVVIEVYVKEGDPVAAGQPLLLIESMKLQCQIEAPVAGNIASLSVEDGQLFDKGATLVAIDPKEDSDS